MFVVFVAVLGRGEVDGDSYPVPFPAFGLVGSGHSHICVGFVIEPVDGCEDGPGSVCVDKLDQRLKLATGRIVFGIILQIAPGGEEDELGVRGAAALLQVVGGVGQGA